MEILEFYTEKCSLLKGGAGVKKNKLLPSEVF